VRGWLALPIRAKTRCGEAAKLGLDTPVYESLPELLSAQPETAMVDICTPLDKHEADALLALKADAICSAKSLWRQPWLPPIGSLQRQRKPECSRK
jgi:hypothetical protein